MSISSTGSVSFQQIATEFNDTSPIALNEFYAGAGLVPQRATGQLGAIPTSGAISAGHFRGSASSLLSGAKFVALSPAYVGTDVPLYEMSDGTVLAKEATYVGQSSDGGFTFVRRAVTGASPNPGAAMVGDYSGGGAMYELGESGVLYGSSYRTTFSPLREYCDLSKSTDKGETWSLLYTQTITQLVSQEARMGIPFTIGSIGGVPRMLTGWYYYNSPGGYANLQMCYSDNSGTSWGTFTVSGMPYYGNQNNYPDLTWWPGAGLGVQAGGDGLFIFSLDTSIRTSPDGMTWTVRPLEDQAGNSLSGIPANMQVQTAIVFQNKLWLRPIGGATTSLLRSDDGSKFVWMTTPLPAYTNGWAVSNDGSYVALSVGNGASAGGIYTTTDMVTFTKRSGLELTNPTGIQAIGDYWFVPGTYYYSPQ